MKLVIFDCDGTLVDSQHIIFEAMRRAFVKSGLAEPPRDSVLGVVGLSLPQAVARLMPEADTGLVAAVSDDYKAAFGELRRDPAHDEPMFHGAIETIRLLAARDGVVLGIATGKSRRGVDALFDRFGLHPHFVTVQTADTHPSKPHPSMIERAMVEAGAAPGATVMVGDTTFDIEMARRAEVGAIGVGWGYHLGDELRLAGAHALIDRFQDLPAAIETVLEELSA